LKRSQQEAMLGATKQTSKTTPKLTMGLTAFCESARSLRPPVPITVETIAMKAKDLSAKLLEAYEQQPTPII
jgi:hypothetical protein